MITRFPGGWWTAPAAVVGLVMWLGIVGLVLADTMPVSWVAPNICVAR